MIHCILPLMTECVSAHRLRDGTLYIAAMTQCVDCSYTEGWNTVYYCHDSVCVTLYAVKYNMTIKLVLVHVSLYVLIFVVMCVLVVIIAHSSF